LLLTVMVYVRAEFNRSVGAARGAAVSDRALDRVAAVVAHRDAGDLSVDDVHDGLVQRADALGAVEGRHAQQGRGRTGGRCSAAAVAVAVLQLPWHPGSPATSLASTPPSRVTTTTLAVRARRERSPNHSRAVVVGSDVTVDG
jgi:hypothetical protein